MHDKGGSGAIINISIVGTVTMPAFFGSMPAHARVLAKFTKWMVLLIINVVRSIIVIIHMQI